MNKNEIIQAFLPFANTLNTHNITWAIGGSLLLALEGYETTIHDVDVLITLEDEPQLLHMLESMNYTLAIPHNLFATKTLYKLHYNNIELDLIIEFAIHTPNGIYKFPFTKDTIMSSRKINETTLYLSSITEWKKAYTAMNRLEKMKLLNTTPTKN